MNDLFRDGWRERMRRVAVAPDTEAPPNPPEGVPLIIGPATDPTLRHFHQRCRAARWPVGWATIEGLAQEGERLARLGRLIERAPGVYFRHGVSEDGASPAVNAVLRALVGRHPNALIPSETSTNWCKPLHVARLGALECGLRVPDSLLSSSHDGADRVLKNCSGAPTYVVDGLGRRVHAVPHLSQDRLRGRELRVHVLDGTCFAAEILTEALDYRSAGGFHLRAATLTPELTRDCATLAASEGLRFAGIDLILTENGAHVIEVNPMPGYHAYEIAEDGPGDISGHLYTALEGGRHEISVVGGDARS